MILKNAKRPIANPNSSFKLSNVEAIVNTINPIRK
jgi:hypothetical protein